MSPWTWLAVAIVFEVTGTTFLKLSDGMSKPIPSILTFVLYGISFTTLAFCLKNIEVGIAYAIWSGLGTALIAFIGVIYFRESISFIKVISLLLIIVGVVGLNIARGEH